ncbi:MAG: HAMP domain-containing protein [Balneolaceae bacterium]|nr:HAMP domain-containing protein [Balneolaceae bacterium]MBO6546388.1 HAMP domain-containing protein [Balneolaceae bacterium]MBO6648747.1 HAMP domain-containing protein [Balneolaceae bacterium]
MRFTISTKLIALLLGLTLVVLIVVISAINNVFSRTINENVVLDFAQLRGFFKVQQSLQYDRLAESAYLISENSLFKANVRLNDPPSVEQSLREFSYFTKSDLFLVTDTDGNVLSWLGRPDSTSVNLTTRKSVEMALRGEEPPVEIEWPQLWEVDDVLYQIVTIPIYLGNTIGGTITLGTTYKDIEAITLKENTSLEVAMFLKDKTIAFSDTSLNEDNFRTEALEKSSLIDSLTSNLVVSEPFRTTLGNTEVLTFISPLGRGERAYYYAYVPTAKQFEILSTLQRNIILIALVSIFVVIPLAIFLARAFSGPIKTLTEAMLKVREGDLNVSLKPKTNDEIGILTKTFNEMIIGLRERFALSKYVGDHTLEMIEKNSETEPDLGGTRQQLAILFTDIRGSTEKIANSEPEIFISYLNRTLSAQADAVLEQDGSIDKFVGDSLIALFTGHDALERAIKCGINIQKSYQSDTEVSDFFDGLGVGINFGPMVLGNMGAKERLDYTVIGPEVNLAARLCSEAQPGQVLLPRNKVQYFGLEQTFSFKTVMKKNLKGFEQEIEIVEVVYE